VGCELSDFTKDLPAAGDRLELPGILGQLLLRADHEVTAIAQHGSHSIKHGVLELGLEIGEDEVAAQDKVERTSWNLGSDVLMQEDQPFAVDGTDAVQMINAVEGNVAPVSGRIGQAACRETASLRALQDNVLNVGPDQFEARFRHSALNLKIPENLERIDLLS
jgi:hypothetical protein